MDPNISKNESYDPVSLEDEPCLWSSSPESLHEPPRRSPTLYTLILCILYAIAAIILVLIGAFLESHRQVILTDQNHSWTGRWVT